jgi:hypothetical protein
MIRNVLFSILSVALLSACTPKGVGGSSQLTLNFPGYKSASTGSLTSAQKLIPGDIDWAKACFMVNVTGDGINSPQNAKCDVPSGAFGGAVKSSETLSLDVLKGTKRKVEVFVYFRSSPADNCVKHGSLNEFDPGSVASVGSTVVDLLADATTVGLDVSLPDANANLVSEFGLPAFCSAATTALGEGSSRILAARSYGTTTHFKVDSVVTGLPTGRAHATASGVIIRFSHEAKDKDTQ